MLETVRKRNQERSAQTSTTKCFLITTNPACCKGLWIICHVDDCHSSQCSTTGVTKAVVCAILPVVLVHIKEPLLLIRKIAYVAPAGFLSHYQNGP